MSTFRLGINYQPRGDQPAAISTYEQGMAQAKAAKDMHSYNELQAAHEDLVY